MAFTYVGDLSTDIDKIRFYTGDVTQGSGPRPSDGNFSDEELTGIISLEGSWQRSIAACFERLAAEWTRHPSFKADGLNLNRSDIAKGYREDARGWRRKYGGTGGGAGTRATTRVDGYSDDVTSHEQ